ncbi:hypothetical protein SAY86_014846 [Trapa natans]|uniref:PHD-type domain-containing protein n=1 Tax=Trapa natans TaxID=22666 RepID=A0AAN7KH82_TRANT|nr:hypothetical protein SAY86_014846 [Trapa natans]
MGTENGEAPNENGVSGCRVTDFSPKCEGPNTVPIVSTGSGPCEGSSGATQSLRTYKRRKQPVKSSSAARSWQDGTMNTKGVAHMETQAANKLSYGTSEGLMFEQGHDSKLACHGSANGLGDSSHGKWCKVLLEQIDNSISEEGGILECIRKAIRHSTDADDTKIKVWRRIEVIGTELASLAKNLVDLSRFSCHELVGKATQCTSSGDNNKVHIEEPLCDTKLKQTEDWSMFRVCTCRCCGERAHGRECLICDSCEDMFHVSCIEPPVQEIPLLNWYCAQCISDGKGSTHENCIVCKRLYSSKIALSGVYEKVNESNTTKDLTDSGDENSTKWSGNSFGICSICGGNMFRDEIIRECSHSLCPHGNYHERCLTAKQLKSYGPCWYCPSCLCRTCLSDQDDDKIVLCDGCDHAYHIYCAKPPLTKIPEGKWFCSKCETGLQAILRVKRACECVKVKGKRGRKKLTDRAVGPGRKKRIKGEPDKVGGGMDMLLNAAKTLNLEEDLVTVNKG